MKNCVRGNFYKIPQEKEFCVHFFLQQARNFVQKESFKKWNFPTDSGGIFKLRHEFSNSDNGKFW